MAVFDIYSKLRLDTTDFSSKLTHSSHQVKSYGANLDALGKRLNSWSKSLTGMGSELSAVFAGAFAKSAMSAFQGLLASRVEMMNLSRQTQIAAGDMARMKFAFDMAGMGLEAFASAVSKQQKFMADGKGDATLKALGLDPEALKAMASDKAFAAIIHNLGNVRNQNERTAYAMAIWSEAGANMLRFLDDGRDKLGEYLGRAKVLGITMKEDVAQSFQQINERMKENAVLSGSLKNNFLTAMRDNVKSYADGWGIVLKWTNDFVKKCPAITAAVSDLGIKLGLISIGIETAIFGFSRFVKYRAVLVGIGESLNILKNINAWAAGGGAASLAVYGTALFGITAGVHALTESIMSLINGGNGSNWIERLVDKIPYAKENIDAMCDALLKLVKMPVAWLSGDSGPQLGDASRRAMASGRVKVDGDSVTIPGQREAIARREHERKVVAQQARMIEILDQMSGRQSAPGLNRMEFGGV